MVFLFFFALEMFSASPVSAADNIISALHSYQKDKNISVLEKIAAERPVINAGENCRFYRSEAGIRSDYYLLDCAGVKYANFILYKTMEKTETDNLFRITDFKIIASQPYFILTPEAGEPRLPHADLRRFRDLILGNRFRQSLTGSSLYFDSTCPLEFIKVDHDFYWDQTVFYTFRITCIETSDYSMVYIPADHAGKILIGKDKRDNILPGERFFAKMTISRILEQHIKWENIIVYPN